MPSYAHSAEQQQDTPAPTTATSTTSGTSNTSNAAGIAQHGGAYTVVRGDTLWSIARRTYGSGRHWREIAQANPTQVFRSGELILVGAVLQLPDLSTETAASPEAGAGTGTTSTGAEAEVEAETPDGGVTAAHLPRGVCTEYGDFNIYPDAFVGPLPASTDGMRNVREAEYTEIIAAAEAEAEAQREEVEGEVEDLLSYGAFDWAITDGEATRALALLGGLPLSQLEAAIGNIPNIDRLIEQLPASARSGEAFTRVLVALGPSRVGAYLQDLLSYGIFDWAVTDSEARAVLAILGMMSGQQRTQLLEKLSRDLRYRLLENLPVRGSGMSDADKGAVQAIFDAAGDDLALLELAFEVRFNLDVRAYEGEAWDAAGLRRCWEVIAELPAGHVEGNPALLQWIRTDDTSTNHSGWYADDRFDEDSYGAGFNYNTTNIDTSTQGSEQDVDGDGTIDVTDPLHGVNRFSKVVRHEVGHAVDEAMGAIGMYCIGQANGGDWKDYGNDPTTCITEMVAAAAGALQGLPTGTRDAIIAAVAADPDNALTAAQGTTEYTALSATDQAAVDGDPVFAALAKALNNPWYRADNGGDPLGGRIFQRSYSSRWTSYSQAARARKVSEYQFRAPGEWFAEAYAAYYEPLADGTCDHSTLNGIDPTTKRWFDTNVDSYAGGR